MTDTQAQEAASLAEWLRQNSSGIYRPAADAADLIERQAARIAELEKAHAIAVEIGAQYASDREALAAELARMREPLSDEQIDALRVESAKAMQSLADRGLIPATEVCDEDLVRRVEAAHGITKTGEQQ